MIFRAILLLISLLFAPFNAHADTYWVDNDGAASWVDCENGGGVPGIKSGAAACSLSTANASALGGDIVYMRGGSYDTNISPDNSGTSTSHMITYQAYTGETPVIEDLGGYSYGITLTGNDYIKISGVTFQNLYGWASIRGGSDFVEVTDCTFTDDDGVMGSKGILVWGQCLGGSPFNCPSSHVWIHNNTMSRAGYIDTSPGCNDLRGILYIGSEYADDTTNHITIEDNTMFHGGHHVIQTRNRYNVIRNNFVHNEGWMTNPGDCCKLGETCPPFDYTCGDPITGMFGNRNIIMQDYHTTGNPSYSLVEGNRIGAAGIASDGNFGGSLTLGYANIITRYNDIYDSMEAGIYCRSSTAIADSLYIYNNTIYKNGSGPQCRKDAWSAMNQDGLECRGPGSTNDVIKNNIVYDSTASDIVTINAVNPTLENNWVTTDGDPDFVNPDISDKTSATLPDLSLQSNSGAVDGGTYLTKADGSGTSDINLTVLDPWYFQDGTWGSALANLEADHIAVGTVNNNSQIVSIDYVSRVIILASALSWADEAPIWLYKKSDEEVVLYGSAPDQGAHESLAVDGGDTFNLSISIGSGNKTMTVGGGSQSISIGQ